MRLIYNKINLNNFEYAYMNTNMHKGIFLELNRYRT